MIRKFCDICNCEINDLTSTTITKRLVDGSSVIITDIGVRYMKESRIPILICKPCSIDIFREAYPK